MERQAVRNLNRNIGGFFFSLDENFPFAQIV